jgi:hypothetical protein
MIWSKEEIENDVTLMVIWLFLGILVEKRVIYFKVFENILVVVFLNFFCFKKILFLILTYYNNIKTHIIFYSWHGFC